MLLYWLRDVELKQFIDPLLVGIGGSHTAEGRQLWNGGLDDLLGLVGHGFQNSPEILNREAVCGGLGPSRFQRQG